MKNLKLGFKVTVLCLLLSPTGFAQAKSEIKEIKGEKNSFNCKIYKTEIDGKGTYTNSFYVNSKYDIEKIHNDRKPDSPGADFIEYKINNHDKFVSAFNKSFTKDRLIDLEEKDVKIWINFILNKEGGILAIEYCLFQEDIITPFELEKLENELLNNLSFTPLEHAEDALPSEYIITTKFKEVVQGEIKKIRQRETEE